MKTILLILFVLACNVGYGQTIKVKNSSSATHICILISPEISKDSTCTDREIWFKSGLLYTTPFRYDRMVRAIEMDSSPGVKIIDIRFEINGRKTDYTFEEFRKILWP